MPAIPADRPIRWGFLGSGNIARGVIKDLRLVPGNEVVAVAGLTPGKAATFARELGVPAFHDDYESLVRRADVDIVYVATTHERHLANALLAIRHGKHVLCEKPMCLNATQAQAMVDAARAAGVFLMEAMWTRFIPATEALLAELAAGVIGEPRLVQADFGISCAIRPGGRMTDPALAGGALLDLGVYPLTFAQLVLGSDATALASTMRPISTGVDGQSSYLLSFSGGRQALLSSSLDLKVPHQARIYGELGRIVVDDFFHAKAYSVERHGEALRRVEKPFAGGGYEFEIMEVAACLRAGRLESAKRPLADSLAVMRWMDALRAPWGLRYPGE